MKKYLKYNNPNSELRDWINTTLKKYLTKNSENQTEIEHILDYLQSNKAPKRLRKMSYKQAKDGAAKWVKSLTKKGNHIDDSGDIKKIKKIDDMYLVKLVGKSAFEREGHMMRHCVGSYYGRSDTEIYSLRDAANQSHCTIEITKDGGEINQIKGKGNGSIHPKYIKSVLKVLKHFKLDVRESEMRNLGYVAVTSEEKKLFLKHGLKLQTVRINNGMYIFNK